MTHKMHESVRAAIYAKYNALLERHGVNPADLAADVVGEQLVIFAVGPKKLKSSPEGQVLTALEKAATRPAILGSLSEAEGKYHLNGAFGAASIVNIIDGALEKAPRRLPGK